MVPAATDQVQAALGPQHELRQAARESTGVKHDILVALDRKLSDVPSGSSLIDPAVQYGRKAFEVLIGTFFVLAASAYWIVERDRAVDLVCSLLPRPRRRTVRDTWDLIELRLGAFVRGQAVLVALVATVLSASFWAIGLPYWLLVGVFAGVVEIVPVIGPLAAGVVAVAVGLSVSVHVAVLAALVVIGVRLLEDYVVLPRVLGHSVGLSPLVVLVSVTTVGLVLGGLRGDPRGAAREHPRHVDRHRPPGQGSRRGAGARRPLPRERPRVTRGRGEPTTGVREPSS